MSKISGLLAAPVLPKHAAELVQWGQLYGAAAPLAREEIGTVALVVGLALLARLWDLQNVPGGNHSSSAFGSSLWTSPLMTTPRYVTGWMCGGDEKPSTNLTRNPHGTGAPRSPHSK